MSTIPVVKNDAPTQLGGRRRKKSNGHKANCGCPICKNMRGSKRGGGEEEDTEFKMGGKKKNGHKANCACPICVNMKHAKGTKRNKRNKRGGSKRRRRGGRNEPTTPPGDLPEEIDEEEFEEEFEDEAGEEDGPEDEYEPKEDIEEDSSDEEMEEDEEEIPPVNFEDFYPPRVSPFEEEDRAALYAERHPLLSGMCDSL